MVRLAFVLLLEVDVRSSAAHGNSESVRAPLHRVDEAVNNCTSILDGEMSGWSRFG